MLKNNLTPASDYHLELSAIETSKLSFRNKYIRLKYLLEEICKNITDPETLQFPSLFSQIVFIAQKYNLPKQLEWQLQNIRVTSNFLIKNDQNTITKAQYRKAKTEIELFILILYDEKANTLSNTSTKEYQDDYEFPMDRLRVQLLEIDKENKNLICKSDLLNSEKLFVYYKHLMTNIHFNDVIDRLWVGVQLNLIDVRINDEMLLLPQHIVIEPDFLIDVSNIADCFQNYGNSDLYYFIRKFEQSINSKHILLGNLANFFLDQLIYCDEIEDSNFETSFLSSFKQMPLEYASCTEISDSSNFRDFMFNAQLQFNNIKRVLLHDMPSNGFDTKKCILEPAFFCEKFGFQGRLDLLQPAEDENGIDRIIELKSGKTPYPREDCSRIAPNHEAQTAIYRLMIQTVFHKQSRQIYPTILYSSAENIGENIRMAAPFKKLETEIINIRNLIVCTEHELYSEKEGVERLFDQLTNTNSYCEKLPPFFKERLRKLQLIINNCSELEKKYFYRFTRFVARELYMQKVGNTASNGFVSISTLWNTQYKEREEALDLISGLEIKEIDNQGRDMKITFSRRKKGESNFREGEICILYPHSEENDSVLTNQILKGNIEKIEENYIIVRFRYKQRNQFFFKKHDYWTIEHDKLDNGYNTMFKSLFSFLSTSISRKELLLGIIPPRSAVSKDHFLDNNIGLEKRSIIQKAINTKDYFILVGPPGTGKTSVFIRQLISKLHKDTDENILVIAYTNRAVDELCTAICSAFDSNNECDTYIRIGTELSCSSLYRNRLLQVISQQVKNRKELQLIIENKRIFVGTLAAIMGKPELFSMKKFNTLIVDEASQILEPQIIGLLPKFERFIMIGDHKQLSTITLQNSSKSEVNDKELNSIELYDCRESLFERLFRLCIKNSWTHAYDILKDHGRMHEELAKFVNRNFYNNQLKTVTKRQQQALDYYINYDTNDKFEKLTAKHRVAFIASRNVELNNIFDKTNTAEADIICNLAKTILVLYRKNNLEFDIEKTLGIITPFRNQIAIIKQKLKETGIAELSAIMVDTVERYQGSQRDIILVSFCINRIQQLNNFLNLDRDGIVDRKLNVTLTRAKEQLFLVGNDLILSQKYPYSNLLKEINII